MPTIAVNASKGATTKMPKRGAMVGRLSMRKVSNASSAPLLDEPGVQRAEQAERADAAPDFGEVLRIHRGYGLARDAIRPATAPSSTTASA